MAVRSAESPEPRVDPADLNWRAFNRAWPAHEKWLNIAQKCNSFYLGDQWDEAEKAALEEEGRPALTINQILQVINAVRGHYSTMRADFQFKPRSGGATAEVAEILTRLFDQIADANDYQFVEARVVEDGWIQDRGYFDVRIDYSHNLLGEVKITSLDPETVVLDPDAKEYDPDTWTEVMVDKWQSPDDIEALYGKDKRKQVEILAMSGSTYGYNSVRFDQHVNTFGQHHTGYVPTPYEEQGRIRAVRVVERQHRRLAMVREFVDLATGESRPVPEGWDEERVQAIKQRFGLATRKRMASRIRWTVTADHVTLFDDWSPYDHFTIIPYFPIFRRGRTSGLVRHLLDPQEQLNKIESQVLHVINTTANSGWLVESGSLVNMTEEDLEQRGAETGLVMVYRTGKGKPEKIQANQIPTGLEMYAGKALQYIKDIPGAGALLGAMPGPEVSGVALDQATSRALSGLQMAFDNLDYTRKLLARHVLRLVQKFYTEPRVFRAVDWRDPEMPEYEIAINQPAQPEEEEEPPGYDAQAIDTVLNDITVGEYAVVVTTAPARDTWEDTQFAQAIEMRNAGIFIPDHYVIGVSNLCGKKKIAEEVKQIQGFGEPTEGQQMVQQMQLREMQAQIAELEAKAMKLQAEAQLAMAKAQTAVAAEQRETQTEVARLQLEAERLQADIAKKAADLQSKLQLAAIHTGAKKELTRYSQMMNRMNKEADREAELQAERMRGLWQARTKAIEQAWNMAGPDAEG